MSKKVRSATPDQAARATRLPPVTRDAVTRLEELAVELDNANKAAELVVDSVRSDIANQLTQHFVNGAPKKR